MACLPSMGPKDCSLIHTLLKTLNAYTGAHLASAQLSYLDSPRTDGIAVDPGTHSMRLKRQISGSLTSALEPQRCPASQPARPPAQYTQLFCPCLQTYSAGPCTVQVRSATSYQCRQEGRSSKRIAQTSQTCQAVAKCSTQNPLDRFCSSSALFSAPVPFVAAE